MKLFISHSIYLTPQERNALVKGPHSLETVGVSVAVRTDKTQEALTEVFCKYVVTNDLKDKSQVELIPEGYKLHIDGFGNCAKLADVPDGGVGSLMLRAEGPLTIDGEEVDAVHQIVIKDVTDLQRSTLCNELAKALTPPPEEETPKN